ncbi:ABC transporter permease [Flagellimonas zhangzhouensis]|uniref:ABC-type antimicrobial peptide transport system, permease component n=1 Tax=Flagellimonas zhangzhouensis TaxID=1073328 RepID=A0A1H2UX40_9FLAO|nr:ABC transporter permease [Allomuricauda zhangzhouensis]SDQ12837.1 ABC-type antimicrobial peptide transport system, permease component [Allomuricauda zhangzhouensis]SDW60643.1 ABC-type antimicrobial peptide transport system, permease component [Allomuricauda zhangzhouensis]
MLKNYLKIAWRNLTKHKAYTIINVGGLALGMAVTLIIGLWINDELNHNSHFPQKDKIAQVYQSQTMNGQTGTGPAIPRPLEMAMREDYMDNFKYVVMSSWNTPQYLKNGETSLSRNGYFIQRDAPEMLDLKIIKGEKDGLREINTIMLSESSANALFSNEDPIGKTLKVNSEHDMMVTAVYEDIPFNTSFSDADYLMPWAKYVTLWDWVKRSEDYWDNNSFQMFVQIADNTTIEAVSEKIRDVKKIKDPDLVEFNPEMFLLPMEDWYLRSNFQNGKQVGGRIKYVWLFGIIGVFVLLLACINFMNLSTARSEKRAKEVGIRKSIGSQRGQLINQFLGESFLVVLLAFIIAVGIVVLSLSGFNELARKEMEFPWTSLLFWGVSLVFILITALLAGSYPALYLSSFRPVDVLKGTFKTGKHSGLPRKILVVVQFTVSVAFIIGTVIVMQQINHAKNRPIGYDKEGLVQIPTMSQDFTGKFELMRDEFIKSGAVTEMSTSSAPTTRIWSNRSGFNWEGKPEGFQEDLAWTEVSPEYAKSLGLKIVAGRDFSRDFASDSLGILINETAVKYMGLQDPVGQIITDSDTEDPFEPMKIIGVVEDMIAQSPYEPVKQGWYVFDRNDNGSFYNMRLNPNKSASENIAIIERVFKEHFPNIPFQYDFVDEEYGKKFASEVRVGRLSGIFTALAILISCLGLFGLTSFVAEQRTKEIGVRKVLGASVFNVWNMLSKDFLKLVVISCFIAVPIAYYVMNGWLQEYPYRVILKWWIFALAMIGAFLLTIITVSFQAIKAAKSNPTKSLRTE